MTDTVSAKLSSTSSPLAFSMSIKHVILDIVGIHLVEVAHCIHDVDRLDLLPFDARIEPGELGFQTTMISRRNQLPHVIQI